MRSQRIILCWLQGWMLYGKLEINKSEKWSGRWTANEKIRQRSETAKGIKPFKRSGNRIEPDGDHRPFANNGRVEPGDTRHSWIHMRIYESRTCLYFWIYRKTEYLPQHQWVVRGRRQTPDGQSSGCSVYGDAILAQTVPAWRESGNWRYRGGKGWDAAGISSA